MEIFASVAEEIQGGRRNRAATAYEIVLDMILDGVLPGGTIVEENVLAANLGFSRTPLREALGRLQGEGFILRQGRKLVVHSVTERDFIEILHLRRILEAEAVALATPRLRPEQISEIRAALTSLQYGEHSTEERWQVDDLLHRAIAEASGNNRLARAIVAILGAIEGGNPEQARYAMLAHIESVRTNILRKLGGF